jgi:predicted transcriptional regulator
MRREHESIAVDVLDALARYLEEEQGPFHITVLATRANLPHDRLRTYLDELATLGLVERDRTPRLSVKGRQFLECYHAWVRVQKIYGLDPRAGRGQAVRVLQVVPAAAHAGAPAAQTEVPMVPAPAPLGDAHDSFGAL